MRKRSLLVCLALGTLSIPADAAKSQAEKMKMRARAVERVALHAADLRERAARVGMKETLVIEGVADEMGEAAGDLVLERFRVFRPDAEIVVHTPHGSERREPPKNLYFRGFVEGDLASRAVVTVRENGGVRGVVLNGERTFILSDERHHRRGGPMAMRSLTPDELDQNAEPFACSTDRLAGGQTLEQLLPAPTPLPGASASEADRLLAEMATSYALTLAVETDYEFYQLFGNTVDAADYVADIISYVSTFYEAEINTSLELGEVSLWSYSGDPWTQSSTLCGLLEFGRTWNNTRTNVDRGLAHFMSGKNNGGGVAWRDVLCDSSFTYNHAGECPGLTPQTSNYGGAYGYSGTLDGDFDINNPSVLWDVVVVAHELGHNFGSPHSHCYGGIGGNANAVDSCYTGECGYSGCACSNTGLPSGCPGNSQGCGTIMSYCHLLTGGMSNISMSFGTDHPYGDEPERIANYMSERVAATETSYPSCLAPSNSPPSAVADSYDVGQNLELAVGAPGVLVNDSDPEGDTLTASLVSGAANGNVSLQSDGSFTYTPDFGFSGGDSFTYVADDGSESSATTLVSIEVQPCTGAGEVTVESMTVTGSVNYTACNRITAGPAVSVAATGDLSLEAAEVVLVNGFSVDGGALSILNR